MKPFKYPSLRNVGTEIVKKTLGIQDARGLGNFLSTKSVDVQ